MGVLPALSTRTCLEPERGVMLLLERKADTGETISSLSRPYVPLLPGARSGLAVRRGSGVVTVGLGVCSVGARVATFGVSGGLTTARATVGMAGERTLEVDEGFSKAMLARSVDSRRPGGGFIIRRVDGTLWSRRWRGNRWSVAEAGVEGAEFEVAVSRVVLFPELDVVVVRIPADGFRLREGVAPMLGEEEDDDEVDRGVGREVGAEAEVERWFGVEVDESVDDGIFGPSPA